MRSPSPPLCSELPSQHVVCEFSVNKQHLLRLLTLRRSLRMQPQRGVGGLHRFPHHPDQVVV
jgi:hypothetical protein